MSFVVCLRGSSRRPVRKILAPSSAKRRAMERPRPVPPPVMKIVRPFSRFGWYMGVPPFEIVAFILPTWRLECKANSKRQRETRMQESRRDVGVTDWQRRHQMRAELGCWLYLSAELK